MSETTKARHNISLAGFVCDALTGEILPGADVLLTAMPAAFASWVELSKTMLGSYQRKLGRRWNSMAERPDRTRSRADGSFYFLDLPDGEYTATVSAPAYGARYGMAEIKVTLPFATTGKTIPDWPLVLLPPTSVQGGITSKKANIGFAHVRVQGSGETTRTDKAGQYRLTRLEPGRRTLLVNAQGYQAVAQEIAISGPGVLQVVNFNLLPDKG